MHALCVLLGHRYSILANYNNATDNYTHIISSCTRCGNIQIKPTGFGTIDAPKPKKQRAVKAATTNP